MPDRAGDAVDGDLAAKDGREQLGRQGEPQQDNEHCWKEQMADIEQFV